MRKVSSGSIISTVVGIGGLAGFNDGSFSTRLNNPMGVAVDATGNLFIADTLNHRIRKATPAGFVSTVVGTTIGFGGDTQPAASSQLNNPRSVALDAVGNMFIADTFNQRIR